MPTELIHTVVALSSSVALAVVVIVVLLGPVGRRKASRPADEEHWKTVAEEEHRKRMETIGVVEGVMRERDIYKKWWWEHAAQHDAAQTLLAQEIRRCYRLLTKNNIKIREKEELLELPQVFHRATAPEVMLEKRGRIEQDRTPAHAELETARTPQIAPIEAKGVAKEDSNA